jgi:hypothetical protein
VNPVKKSIESESRRDFVKMTAAASLVAGVSGFIPGEGDGQTAGNSAAWFRRTYRWGQINLNEKDPLHYDLQWWRSYWKRTQIQGVIINAGGIVAYYPSKDPLQHQAKFLSGGDLYGDLVRAARADGLRVFARMDCGSAFEPFYEAHPDWFAMTAEGKPYRTGGRRDAPATGPAPGEEDDVVLYTTCINGPYYDE